MNIPQITEGKPNRSNKNKKPETGRSCTINRSAEHRCQSSPGEKTIEETARDSFHPAEDRVKALQKKMGEDKYRLYPDILLSETMTHLQVEDLKGRTL